MDTNELRALDELLVGNSYDDATFDGLAPLVGEHRAGLAALRAVDVADVPNGLVAVAGGRKPGLTS